MKRTLYLIGGLIGSLCVAGAALAGMPVPVEAYTDNVDFGVAGSALPFLGGLGLIVNKATLDGLARNIKTSFQKVFESKTGNWQDTTMKIPSTGSENDYKWLTGFPAMRRWIGDKVINALKANQYVVANDDFEATIKVDRNDIEDGNLSGYSVQAEMAGESAGELYDDLDAEAKNGAFINKCFDKQYFYDTDHPVEDENGNTVSVSNKLTAPLSNANLAAAQASFGAARQMLLDMKRDGGKKLGINGGDTLECGSALEITAKALMNDEKLADGTPNPYRGLAKVKLNSRLDSTTQWMLHDTSRKVKPFIIQERKKPVFVSQTDMNADGVFMRKEYLYGAEARAASAYGFWQLSVGSTGAG